LKLFSKIPTYVITIPQCHGQMDGQMTCHSNTVLCIALRGKNTLMTELGCYMRQQQHCAQLPNILTLKTLSRCLHTTANRHKQQSNHMIFLVKYLLSVQCCPAKPGRASALVVSDV